MNSILDVLDWIFDEIKSCIKEAKDFEVKQKESFIYKLLRHLLADNINKRGEIYLFTLHEKKINGKSFKEHINEHIEDITEHQQNSLDDISIPYKPKSSKRAKAEEYISGIISYEARKMHKIIDSMYIDVVFGAERVIIEELMKNPSDDTIMKNTKIFCKNLDSYLYCALDEISDLEQKGYKAYFIKKDINEVLHSIFSAFAIFNIDITPIIKENSDFEKEFGNYDIFKITNIPVESVSSEHQKKAFNHGWTDDQLIHIAEELQKEGRIDNIQQFYDVMNKKQGCIKWLTNKTDLKIFILYFCQQIEYNPYPVKISGTEFPMAEAIPLFDLEGKKLTKGGFSIKANNIYDKLFESIY